jgi:ubiquitin-small subunit ribosomal protein S27Ae
MIMAGPKDDKKGAKKPAGGAPKKAKGKPMSKMYAITGNSIKRNNKSCPKCGAGTFMAAHKDRATCGKCKYTERK